jgi:hypothetical protein
LSAVLVNTLTFKRWQLVQTTTVAIVCATGIYASLFSRLSGREGTKSKIGIARIECSNTQRQKRCEKDENHGKRPPAAFHGSTPFGLIRRIALSIG